MNGFLNKISTNVYNRELTVHNIGYMTLTGLCDLCGAFSHDRYDWWMPITMTVSQV